MTTHRATLIIEQLERRATPSVKAWMTNYMKGSTPFIGCKIPVVRESVRCVVGQASKKRGRGDDDDDGLKTTSIATTTYVEDAISLLRHDCGDAKQAGIILLCEHEPLSTLSDEKMLSQLETQVLRTKERYVNDWAVADSLAIKVLKRMWKNNPRLAPKILSWASDESATLWHRRLGIVAFVKELGSLPKGIDAFQLVNACEDNLLAAPDERFAQTGTAWVTRYALACGDDAVREHALNMVVRHGKLWTTEAKKSLVEQITRDTATKDRILNLG